MPPVRAAFAEFVGTFALMFIGGGAIIMGGDLLTVALAHGLILAVMVSAALQLSGAQFNPAVSITVAAIGKQPWSQAILFIIVQLAGACSPRLGSKPFSPECPAPPSATSARPSEL